MGQVAEQTQHPRHEAPRRESKRQKKESTRSASAARAERAQCTAPEQAATGVHGSPTEEPRDSQQRSLVRHTESRRVADLHAEPLKAPYG